MPAPQVLTVADDRAAWRCSAVPVLRAARRLGGVVLGGLCLVTVSLGAVSTPLVALLIVYPVLAGTAIARYR